MSGAARSGGAPAPSAASNIVYVDNYVSRAIFATTYDAVQSALDAAVAKLTAKSSVTLAFGAREYDLNKGATYLTGGQNLKLAPNTPNWLRITGGGQARLKFGVGTPGLLGPQGPTTNNTYGKVEIDGFHFDANNASASAVGIVTNFNANDHNIDGFHIHDCTGDNAGPLANGSGRRWVGLNITTPTAFDVANQRILNDVKLERLTFKGGNTGALISAFASSLPPDNQFFGQTVTAANVVIDKIVVRDFTWDSGSTFYGSIGSAGIQVGGDGYLKSVLIEDSSLANGGDVGVEVGGGIDVLVRNVRCENFVNDALFLSNNHGGMPTPEQQHARFLDCTVIASEGRMTSPMAAFALQSNHGSKFGFVEVVGLKYRHTAPTISVLSSGAPQGAPTAPFLLYGSWLCVSIRDCDVIYDNLDFVFTASMLSFAPAIIDCIQSGDVGVLEVKNVVAGYQGTLDSANVASTALQVDGMRLRGTRLFLDVDGFYMWSNLVRAGSPVPSIRFRDISLTAPTSFDDTFAGNSLNEDYVIEAGSMADVNYTVHPVTPLANYTTRKMFKAPSLLNAATGLMSHVGRVLDSAPYAEATAPTGSTAGFEVIARCRVSDDGQNELRAIVDGTASTLRLEKVQSGVVTVLAGPTALPAALTPGQVVGVRLTHRGDSLTADYYADTTGRTVNTVGATRVAYTLTSTDARRFRGNGAPGFVGFGWTPGDATSTLVKFRYDSMGVYSGHIRGLSPLQHVDIGTSNAVLGGDSTRLRVENAPLKLEWQRAATIPHGPTEISGPDATFKQQMLVEPGSVWGAPPVPAALTVGASPYTYINQDAYMEDIYLYGGTFSLVEVSINGGVTFNQIAAAGPLGPVRLMPGQQLRVTYTVAPTMRRVPVL